MKKPGRPKGEKNLERFTMNIDAELLDKVIQLALTENVSVSKILTRIISAYFKA